MATPIGHALAGYAIYHLNAGTNPERQPTLLWWCLVMAIAPDLDFIPGLLRGQPNLYHQGISHSVGVALAVSFIIALTFLRKDGFWTAWGLLFLAYGSHLAIDFFGPDRRPPYGQPLFWPVSHTYYLSPTPIFLGVRHGKTVAATPGEWITGVLQVQNLAALAVEIVVLAPLVLCIRYIQRLRISLQGNTATGEKSDAVARKRWRRSTAE